MHLIVLGLNHHTAPVELRERLSFGPGSLSRALEELRQVPLVMEWVILSTCNRTELYVTGEHGVTAPCRQFLARHGNLEEQELEPHLYRQVGRDAVRHLFRVAAGMDSMVVGESEVLGQVKQALEAAERSESVGPLLGRLFRAAIALGKRVRAETDIGRGAFLAGGCAVQLARRIFGDLSRKQVLILGAGDMAEATARSLAASGVRSVFVANRTYQRAAELAHQLGGTAVGYDEIGQQLQSCDIVISSTASPTPILTRAEVAAAMRARRNRPLFLIYIAVPRDIEPAAAELDNVYLYNIDDLSAVVEQDARSRAREVARAEEMVHQASEEFMCWYGSLRAGPTIAQLRHKLEDIRAAELARALRRLPHLSESDRQVLDQLTAAIVNKILHTPTVQLKDGLSRGEGDARIELVRKLFQLEGEERSQEETAT